MGVLRTRDSEFGIAGSVSKFCIWRFSRPQDAHSSVGRFQYPDFLSLRNKFPVSRPQNAISLTGRFPHPDRIQFLMNYKRVELKGRHQE